MRIVVSIPAYNEEQNIRDVITRIPRSIVKDNDVTVSVVDDGSTDSTALVAKASGAEYITRHSANLGIAVAFKTGLDCALALDPDIIVNIDADGQFDPGEIPRLIQPIIERNADVVLGSRFLGRSTRGMPLVKRIGNLIVSNVVGIIIARKISDTQCGFRAMSVFAARKLKVSGLFTYTQEMILDLSFKRMSIVEVPVSVRYFKNRKSRVVKSVPGYTFRVLAVIMYTILRYFKWVLVAIVGFSTFAALFALL